MRLAAVGIIEARSNRASMKSHFSHQGSEMLSPAAMFPTRSHSDAYIIHLSP